MGRFSDFFPLDEYRWYEFIEIGYGSFWRKDYFRKRMKILFGGHAWVKT